MGARGGQGALYEPLPDRTYPSEGAFPLTAKGAFTSSQHAVNSMSVETSETLLY